MYTYHYFLGQQSREKIKDVSRYLLRSGIVFLCLLLLPMGSQVSGQIAGHKRLRLYHEVESSRDSWFRRCGAAQTCLDDPPQSLGDIVEHPASVDR